jgi:hypothetical protein
MSNGLVTQSSAPASKAATLPRSSRADKIRIGTDVQPPSPRITSMPLIPGSPRSSNTRSGWWRDARSRALLTCRRHIDVVAAGAQVDRHRPQDRLLVIDDEHSAHATGRPINTVVPHPECRRSRSSQPSPSRSREPRPGRGRHRRVGCRQGAGTAGRCAHGRASGPRPPVDNADFDPLAELLMSSSRHRRRSRFPA